METVGTRERGDAKEDLTGLYVKEDIKTLRIRTAKDLESR